LYATPCGKQQEYKAKTVDGGQSKVFLTKCSGHCRQGAAAG